MATSEQRLSYVIQFDDQGTPTIRRVVGALGDLKGASDSAGVGLTRMQGRIITLESALSLLSRGLLLLQSTAHAAFGSLLNEGDRLDKLSRQFQVPAGRLSELSFAARQAGVDLGGLGQTFAAQARAIVGASEQGSRANKVLVQQLGFTQAQLKGLRGDPLTALLEIGRAFSRFEDGAGKAAAAQVIFGRGGQEFLALTNRRVEALRADIELTRRYGAVLSGETSRAAARAKDSLGQLALSFDGIRNRLLGDPRLLNAFSQAMESSADAVSRFGLRLADAMGPRLTQVVEDAGKSFVDFLDGLSDEEVTSFAASIDSLARSFSDLIGLLKDVPAAWKSARELFMGGFTVGGNLRSQILGDRAEMQRVQRADSLLRTPLRGAPSVMAGLTGQGFSMVEAAGITGNIRAESSFNAGVTNSIGAVGLMQWLGPRKQGLMNYARATGRNWQDPQVQFEWIALERNGGSTRFGGSNEARSYARAFGGGGSAADVAERFARYVERPSSSELAGSMGLRRSTASSLFSDPAFQSYIGDEERGKLKTGLGEGLFDQADENAKKLAELRKEVAILITDLPLFEQEIQVAAAGFGDLSKQAEPLLREKALHAIFRGVDEEIAAATADLERLRDPLGAVNQETEVYLQKLGLVGEAADKVRPKVRELFSIRAETNVKEMFQGIDQEIAKARDAFKATQDPIGMLTRQVDEYIRGLGVTGETADRVRPKVEELFDLQNAEKVSLLTREWHDRLEELVNPATAARHEMRDAVIEAEKLGATDLVPLIQQTFDLETRMAGLSDIMSPIGDAFSTLVDGLISGTRGLDTALDGLRNTALKIVQDVLLSLAKAAALRVLLGTPISETLAGESGILGGLFKLIGGVGGVAGNTSSGTAVVSGLSGLAAAAGGRGGGGGLGAIQTGLGVISSLSTLSGGLGGPTTSSVLGGLAGALGFGATTAAVSGLGPAIGAAAIPLAAAGTSAAIAPGAMIGALPAGGAVLAGLGVGGAAPGAGAILTGAGFTAAGTALPAGTGTVLATPAATGAAAGGISAGVAAGGIVAAVVGAIINTLGFMKNLNSFPERQGGVIDPKMNFANQASIYGAFPIAAGARFAADGNLGAAVLSQVLPGIGQVIAANTFLKAGREDFQAQLIDAIADRFVDRNVEGAGAFRRIVTAGGTEATGPANFGGISDDAAIAFGAALAGQRGGGSEPAFARNIAAAAERSGLDLFQALREGGLDAFDVLQGINQTFGEGAKEAENYSRAVRGLFEIILQLREGPQGRLEQLVRSGDTAQERKFTVKELRDVVRGGRQARQILGDAFSGAGDVQGFTSSVVSGVGGLITGTIGEALFGRRGPLSDIITEPVAAARVAARTARREARQDARARGSAGRRGGREVTLEERLEIAQAGVEAVTTAVGASLPEVAQRLKEAAPLLRDAFRAGQDVALTLAEAVGDFAQAASILMQQARDTLANGGDATGLLARAAENRRKAQDLDLKTEVPVQVALGDFGGAASNLVGAVRGSRARQGRLTNADLFLLAGAADLQNRQTDVDADVNARFQAATGDLGGSASTIVGAVRNRLGRSGGILSAADAFGLAIAATLQDAQAKIDAQVAVALGDLGGAASTLVSTVRLGAGRGGPIDQRTLGQAIGLLNRQATIDASINTAVAFGTGDFAGAAGTQRSEAVRLLNLGFREAGETAAQLAGALAGVAANSDLVASVFEAMGAAGAQGRDPTRAARELLEAGLEPFRAALDAAQDVRTGIRERGGILAAGSDQTGRARAQIAAAQERADRARRELFGPADNNLAGSLQNPRKAIDLLQEYASAQFDALEQQRDLAVNLRDLFKGIKDFARDTSESVDVLRRGPRAQRDILARRQAELTSLLPTALGPEGEARDDALARIQQIIPQLLDLAQSTFAPGSAQFREILDLVESVSGQLGGLATSQIEQQTQALTSIDAQVAALTPSLDRVAAAIETLVTTELHDEIGRLITVFGGESTNIGQILTDIRDALPTTGAAHGGVALAGQAMWVGERGRPELFTPGATGYITPGEMVRGGGPSITVNATVGEVRVDGGGDPTRAAKVVAQALASNLAPELRREVQRIAKGA